MKLRVWGARGSIPVSGPQYVRYGGDTTCVELTTAQGETVILDAGTGMRPLGNKLVDDGVTDARLLLTHAHWDHLMGFPFYRPLFRADSSLHVHGCTFAQDSIRTFLEVAMTPPFFPVALDDLPGRLTFDDQCGLSFPVGSLRCKSIALSHPNQGWGFRLFEGAHSVAFFPDNELSYPHTGGQSFDAYRDFVRGAEVLIHDAEYLPEEYEAFSRGFGHSIYRDTVRLAIEAEVGTLVLWHLNQDRDDDDCDALLQLARDQVAQAGSPLQVEMGRVGLELSI